MPDPQSSPASPSPVFHPFDLSPPAVSTCMDAVYEAFAKYPIGERFCRQCFTTDEEQAMRRQADIRQAAPKLFENIYLDHPNCSGGLSTFQHWLPRGLEVWLFEDRFTQPLRCQMARNGLPGWAEEDLATLRTLFCRIALNWLENIDCSPLGPFNPENDPDLADAFRWDATCGIFAILILLRVDMATVFPHFVTSEREDIWSAFLDLYGSGSSWLDDDSYYLLKDGEEEAQMRVAMAALHRRACADLVGAAGETRMLEKWLTVEKTQPLSPERREKLEAEFQALPKEQTEAGRAAAEAQIIRGFRLDRPSGTMVMKG